MEEVVVVELLPEVVEALPEIVEALPEVFDVIKGITTFVDLFNDGEANTDTESYYEEIVIEFEDIGAKLDITNQLLGLTFVTICLTIVTTVIVKTFFTGW